MDAALTLRRGAVMGAAFLSSHLLLLPLTDHLLLPANPLVFPLLQLPVATSRPPVGQSEGGTYLRRSSSSAFCFFLSSIWIRRDSFRSSSALIWTEERAGRAQERQREGREIERGEGGDRRPSVALSGTQSRSPSALALASLEISSRPLPLPASASRHSPARRIREGTDREVNLLHSDLGLQSSGVLQLHQE
jgi:hypothetical protein